MTAVTGKGLCADFLDVDRRRRRRPAPLGLGLGRRRGLDLDDDRRLGRVRRLLNYENHYNTTINSQNQFENNKCITFACASSSLILFSNASAFAVASSRSFVRCSTRRLRTSGGTVAV